MAVGKRHSTSEPLTEHDVAERLERAALRLLRLLMDVRQLDLVDQVKHSRYTTNALPALAAELQTWGITPQPLKASTDPADMAPADSPADTANQPEGGTTF